ncbi:MAG: putative DNA binding domain-containing protein [Tannerellaceae bacterium]|jgi:predicted HTH transcriptional regulator|nr:putative DNA binding domain-containing protein [Tannerellaceae bacterium]
MIVKEIIKQTEGRRLEFKETLPEHTDLANTIIAFANDAGGELYIGIRNNPREITGLPEDNLIQIEEQVSNIIFDRCYPAILPDITFLTEEDKHIIRVTVYRGSAIPYYRKDKGKLKGTYIRVGSSNRLADEEVIAELERRRRNVSFDSEWVMDKPSHELNIENFKWEYRDKTGEELDVQALRKLELVKTMNGTTYPSNALVLLSDDELRHSLFPFAKVECARFKGITSEEFIDQKSISSNIALQAEDAYNFVLRHVNKGAVVEGVYTISRWEYPVKAIREAIRNAIVHRDYSLAGKDVKVAVYDDMVEITSPGLLPPSIDYAAMESRQSDARNKIIAPVFKRMGIIDQWGNGLKLIADELKDYPQIEFRWKEPGLSFQVQFVKLDYTAQQDLQQEQQDLQQDLQQELDNPTMYTEALQKIAEAALSRKEISEALGQKQVSGQLNKILSKLIDDRLIEHTIPETRNHPDQKFRITKRGVAFLELLTK